VEEIESDSDSSNNENGNSETLSQTSEVSKDTEISEHSQVGRPYNEIIFKGFEEDVEEVMKDLEEYFDKHLIEIKKVFLLKIRFRFLISFD
jgi:hypothetical protein